MSRAKPLLSDIRLTKKKFNPGDCLLVRVSSNLTSDQNKRISKAVNKFAGEDVKVFIVDCTATRIIRIRQGKQPERIAGPEDINVNSMEIIKMGVANLDCSVIKFEPGDQLIVSIPVIPSDLQRKQIHQWVQEWTGKDVEIRVVEGLF